jgi:hypothetical protein
MIWNGPWEEHQWVYHDFYFSGYVVFKYETLWLRPIGTLAKDHPRLQSSKSDNSQLHVNLGIEG